MLASISVEVNQLYNCVFIEVGRSCAHGHTGITYADLRLSCPDILARMVDTIGRTLTHVCALVGLLIPSVLFYVMFLFMEG